MLGFGDVAFHLGLAELLLGWLLEIGVAVLEALLGAAGAFATPDAAALTRFAGSVRATLARERCRVELLGAADPPRLLLHGWRRRTGDTGKRVRL
jgi:hypothetical protein